MIRMINIIKKLENTLEHIKGGIFKWVSSRENMIGNFKMEAGEGLGKLLDKK